MTDHCQAGRLAARKESHAVELGQRPRIAENDSRKVRVVRIAKQARRDAVFARQIGYRRTDRAAGRGPNLEYSAVLRRSMDRRSHGMRSAARSLKQALFAQPLAVGFSER